MNKSNYCKNSCELVVEKLIVLKLVIVKQVVIKLFIDSNTI